MLLKDLTDASDHGKMFILSTVENELRSMGFKIDHSKWIETDSKTFRYEGETMYGHEFRVVIREMRNNGIVFSLWRNTDFDGIIGSTHTADY